MGQFYEVQFAKRLDGTDNYGNVTDSVKFTTEDQTALFKHQPKTTVDPGTKLYGHIEDAPTRSGGTYRKFVREQQEQGFTPQPSSSVGGNGRSSSNSDGMRQGMSINNATTLIEAFIKTGVYTNTDPKQVVADLANFAREIYKIDLSESEAKQQDVVVEPTEEELQKPFDLGDVDALFPGSQTVSNPGSVN